MFVFLPYYCSGFISLIFFSEFMAPFPLFTPIKPVAQYMKMKCTYSPTKLIRAYKAVQEEKLPVQQAANIYGVPISTLKDKVHGRVSINTTKSGPVNVLSLYQEFQFGRTSKGRLGKADHHTGY